LKLPLYPTCPVRGCGLALERLDRRFACENGHSFDIARSGYVNLLQPQDRRSKQPGDTTAAVAARRRLHDRGVTEPLLEAVAEFPIAEDAILDAGCGEGFYLGNLARYADCAGAGVDISTAAVEAAARRYPDCLWVAANADRAIPFGDATFTTVLSITGRRNVPEFRRVLKDGGRLIVGVPAPDDLIEVRGHGRDRVERALAELTPGFELIEQRRATTTAELDEAGVRDVLHAIYRPLRAQPVTAMRVTFSLDLLLLRRI
jgi:23S rRNA (guanine745-N1)-methyltransferase